MLWVHRGSLLRGVTLSSLFPLRTRRDKDSRLCPRLPGSSPAPTMLLTWDMVSTLPFLASNTLCALRYFSSECLTLPVLLFSHPSGQKESYSSSMPLNLTLIWKRPGKAESPWWLISCDSRLAHSPRSGMALGTTEDVWYWPGAGFILPLQMGKLPLAAAFSCYSSYLPFSLCLKKAETSSAPTQPEA